MSDSNPSSVLANLTATYTDSDVSDDDQQSTKTKTKKTSTLVSYSYLDDAEKDEIADEIDESYLVVKKEKVTTPIKEEKSIDEDEQPVVSESVASKYEDFDIIMPPEPPGKCPPGLQARIARFYERKLNEGLDMNALIENRKDFRNPSIYEKLISFCGIDEYGTNFPRDYPFGPESYYEELAKAQKIEMDKRQDKSERTKVEFVSGTKKTAPTPVVAVTKPGKETTTTATTTTSSSSSSKGTDENKKRKSKWDVGASSQSVISSSVVKPLLANPPGIVPVTATASGNKATVISAFGTITKKAKQ